MVVKSVQTGKKSSKVKRKNSSQKKTLSCFAAVVPANIKLVYLKRSLLQDLAKVPESFHEKVVGSFVKIKSVPKACLQKNSYQLERVTGITSLDSEIHLQLSPAFRDVPLHLLSNGNFTEEECDDVHERVKAGTLQRLTVNDLEAKAKILHEDITKHSISLELSMLQSLIDQANEKGWREKKEAYLEKRQELENPEEVETRLSQTPKVIAGATESESSVNAPEAVEVDIVDSNCNNGHEELDILSRTPAVESSEDKLSRTPAVESSEAGIEVVEVDSEAGIEVVEVDSEAGVEVVQVDSEAGVEVVEVDSEASYWINVHGFDVDTPKWHYFDPQGDIQGPFNLRSLKIWYNNHYFEDEAIIWKTGQNPDDDGLRMWQVLYSAFRMKKKKSG